MSDTTYLEALRAYWKQHQAFPSMSKLREVVGLSSTSSVFAMVTRLVTAGYLERTEGRIAPTRWFFARTLLPSADPANCAAALEFLTIDDYLIENPNRTVLCQVEGESMNDAGFLDGDIVTVETNAPTQPGDVVVAVVAKRRVLRVLRFDGGGQYYLQAANKLLGDTGDIHPEGTLDVLGVVTGMFRKTRR